jgi:hypothetical protein
MLTFYESEQEAFGEGRAIAERFTPPLDITDVALYYSAFLPRFGARKRCLASLG